MHVRAWLASLSLALCLGCGAPAPDEGRAKASALARLDGSLTALDAASEHTRTDEEADRVTALRAQADTLREMSGSFSLADVESRARAIEYDARHLRKLLNERAASQEEPEPEAGPSPSKDPEPAVPTTEREKVRAAYEAARTKAAALAKVAGADAVASIEAHLSKVHAAIESCNRHEREGNSDAAAASLEEARDGLELVAFELDAVEAFPPRAGPERLAAQVRRTARTQPKPREERVAPRRPAPAPAEAALSPKELFDVLAPSVVAIKTFDYRHRPIGQGSGFFVTTDGNVVTNHHVIDDAHSAVIVTHDGREIAATHVLSTSETMDLAILRTNAMGVTPLKVSTGRAPAVGATAYAIGNPRGLRNSLSQGLISGHRRTREGTRVLQTSASISPGSSGGPLLDAKGVVVGVIYATLTESQSLNLAVDASELRAFLRGRNHGGWRLDEPGPVPNLYAAIAWSKITGRYGWSNDQVSRSKAEREARKAAGRGARVVAWTRNGWVAFAYGSDGGWAAANDDTKQLASLRALEAALKRSRNPRVEVVICADATQR